MTEKMKEKSGIGFIMCVCTGKCPGFSKLDIWDFINIIRAEYPVEYAFVHPMLCDEDGDRFLSEFLRKDRKYIIGGCAPIMQKKMFKDAFNAAGLDIDNALIPLDIRDMNTKQALEKVRTAIKDMG
ncbi:MAG: hypothetical protein ACTSYO_04665 [Candidatus Ranarchaeia archaeon]